MAIRGRYGAVHIYSLVKEHPPVSGRVRLARREESYRRRSALSAVKCSFFGRFFDGVPSRGSLWSHAKAQARRPRRGAKCGRLRLRGTFSRRCQTYQFADRWRNPL